MDTLRICKQCQQPVPANAPEGLCPGCLAKAALETDPSAPGATTNVSPLAEAASTLTLNPAAGVRVRYFGDYELQEEIARGGMGVVWKARQSSLNRTVALKMILAGKLAGETEVQRFRREAQAAANLQHPNIVAIHEVGEHDGQQYYSMDYVAGRDLGALVRESGPLPPARAAECLKTIAEAVHFAHQRGTLHRDLKPQNVLIDAAGVPHIADFGLAKFVESDESLTQTGAAMGSPSYMPPEQAAGHLEQVGPHSDVYALGAILYELLTGRPPFRAETAIATMRQVMESEPVAPRKLNGVVPPDLETICLKCLEKNPVRRYPSARALAEELGRFLNHEPIQALPVSAIRKAESWLRRHPWTLMAAGSFIAMLLAGMLYWQYERVKFLENRSRLIGQELHHPGSRGQELETWKSVNALVFVMTMWANLLFQRYALGMKNWKQIFVRSANLGPTRPVSQRLRIVFGLIGVAALGFWVLYFAKIIQVSVWESPQGWSLWLVAYFGLTYCLWLLFQVVRDYQRFIHGMRGMPSRTWTAEQSETLRQSIFDGRVVGAIKLYRRAIPDASLAEAQDYVGKLAVELNASHPEKFAPPLKPWDLNWRLMAACGVVELGVFAGYWMMMPPVAPTPSLLAAAAGFFLGAGAFFSLRLQAKWRAPAFAFCTALVCAATAEFSQGPLFGGLAFGACMGLSGLTRNRRNCTPTTTHLKSQSKG